MKSKMWSCACQLCIKSIVTGLLHLNKKLSVPNGYWFLNISAADDAFNFDLFVFVTSFSF